MSSGNKINIDYSKEYGSNYCGKFKILKELEHRKSGSVSIVERTLILDAN